MSAKTKYAPLPAPHPASILLGFSMTIPAAVRNRLKLAIQEARDAGESWSSLEARTLISGTNLRKMMLGARYMGPQVAVRLAQALGFELQMTITRRINRAA